MSRACEAEKERASERARADANTFYRRSRLPPRARSPADTHIMLLLPQLGAILRFFMLKNLRIARARAYNLTVASRGKPAEFWGLVSRALQWFYTAPRPLSSLTHTGIHRGVATAAGGSPTPRARPPRSRAVGALAAVVA